MCYFAWKLESVSNILSVIVEAYLESGQRSAMKLFWENFDGKWVFVDFRVFPYSNLWYFLHNLYINECTNARKCEENTRTSYASWNLKDTSSKATFSIKDLFSKCYQIWNLKLWAIIWNYFHFLGSGSQQNLPSKIG